MTEAPNLQALIRQGDEAFFRKDGKVAFAAWRQALAAAPMRMRAQILSRLGFGKSPRGASLLRTMHALEENFPDGTPFVADGMAVWQKLNTFIADPPFIQAAGKHAHLLPLANWHWSLGTVAWAVQQARPLDGDFVELGVFKGHTTAFVAEYLDFGSWDRKWFLYDTFSGVPADQLDPGWAEANRDSYEGTFTVEEVRERFSAYPNIEVIQGRVPEILRERFPDRVAFLHLDLNNATAELAALEFVIDRLVPGGIIVLDDYGWAAAGRQHWEEKAWFKARNLVVLELPTGQGVFVKGAG